MTITPYLAITAAEFLHCKNIPEKIAWMACHFSPYSTGLSNIPETLPYGSILILNDVTPIYKHDPHTVLRQLTECIETLQCSSLLLDFQRPESPEMIQLINLLLAEIPCNTALSAPIAGKYNCPVLLPPCPPWVSLKQYLHDWEGRDIWMEISSETTVLSVGEDGTKLIAADSDCKTDNVHCDQFLHCHYSITLQSNAVQFSFWRTEQDQAELLNEATDLGVTTTVGLYQEFSL